MAKGTKGPGGGRPPGRKGGGGTGPTKGGGGGAGPKGKGPKGGSTSSSSVSGPVGGLVVMVSALAVLFVGTPVAYLAWAWASA